MAIYAPHTRSARLRRTVTVTVLLVTAAIVGPQAFAQDEAAAPVKLDTYTVAPGESLWSIAADLTPEGGDVNAMVITIQRLNAIGGSGLQAGVQLLIPPHEV